jgi:hypothetical protein
VYESRYNKFLESKSMTQILTLELTDQIFVTIRQEAENIGIPAERLAANLLEQKVSQIFRLLMSEEKKAAARINFESHFGEILSDLPTDFDNESIDAELAAEYVDAHEEN